MGGLSISFDSYNQNDISSVLQNRSNKTASGNHIYGDSIELVEAAISEGDDVLADIAWATQMAKYEEQYKNDLKELYARRAAEEEEKRREYSELATESQADKNEPENQNQLIDATNEPSGCPFGCEYHKSGCDIKGNISVNTGENIYHVPGGEWYDETNIRPEYGERWFCTEDEALNNGWRKSKE
jgi:hypothetical protein